MPPPELAPVIPISSRRSENIARPQDTERLEDTVDSAIERMLAAIRAAPGHDRDALRECIKATHTAAHAAAACADACLAEEMVEELTDCVRTLLTAADIFQATTRVLSRQSGSDPVVVRALLTACWTACRAGREVCEEYAPIHDHCRVCARACRAAERACRALLAVLR